MEKKLIHTGYGTYSVYRENGSAEVYNGRSSSARSIGVAVGSIESVPSGGPEFENGEWTVEDNSALSAYILGEARKSDAVTQYNHIVVREYAGRIRILPQTREVEDGLATKIRRAEKQLV